MGHTRMQKKKKLWVLPTSNGTLAPHKHLLRIKNHSKAWALGCNSTHINIEHFWYEYFGLVSVPNTYSTAQIEIYWKFQFYILRLIKKSYLSKYQMMLIVSGNSNNKWHFDVLWCGVTVSCINTSVQTSDNKQVSAIFPSLPVLLVLTWNNMKEHIMSNVIAQSVF